MCCNVKEPVSKDKLWSGGWGAAPNQSDPQSIAALPGNQRPARNHKVKITVNKCGLMTQDKSYWRIYFKQLKSVVYKKKIKANYPAWWGREIGHFNTLISEEKTWRRFSTNFIVVQGLIGDSKCCCRSSKGMQIRQGLGQLMHPTGKLTIPVMQIASKIHKWH